MEFAERMLRKYGWDADKGLGKDNQGMKTALKPVLKFDSRGVGCNQKDEYSNEFKWWEHTYDRAAKKISASREQIETVDNEPMKKKKKRKHHQEDEEEVSPVSTNVIYSRFQKSSVLMGDKEESLRVDKETVMMESKTTTTLTDDELLRICGGRTAHKGARHGIHMNGKLQRLQEQEARSSPSPVSITDEKTVEKVKKKKKKRDE